MKSFAQVYAAKIKNSQRSSSNKSKKPCKGVVLVSKSPNKNAVDKVVYKVGIYNVEVVVRNAPYLLMIDCFVPKISMHYSGMYIPQSATNPNYKSNQAISDCILKKNAKISITTYECKIQVGTVTIKLQPHIDNTNKENKPIANIQQCSTSKQSSTINTNHARLKEISPEMLEIRKDIKECKSNYEDLREGFKEIKEMMHKTLDQQSSTKADQLKEKYNFDEISLPTLKEYATNKIDKEGPSLSIFPEKLRISSTKAGSVLSNSNLSKLQDTIDNQSKDITSIKEAIKTIGNENSTSQVKLEGQLTQLKREVHTSLELILEVLKKIPKSKQEIGVLVRHLKSIGILPCKSGSLQSSHASGMKGDDCLTERSAKDIKMIMEKSRNDGCIKKPRCSTVKGAEMRRI